MEEDYSKIERTWDILEELNGGEIFQNIRKDPSTSFLIFSNLATIFLAIMQKWDIHQLMMVYLIQSAVIGFFTFFKIISLKKFSTKNLKINNKSVSPTKKTKYQTAFFFIFHYGLFHLFYFIILGLTGENDFSLTYLLLPTGIFFINHLYSFLYNYKEDSKKVKNIGAVMFFPYARIIPMHLTIIFGSFLVFNTYTLILFLVLKTIADVIMHLIEHSKE